MEAEQVKIVIQYQDHAFAPFDEESLELASTLDENSVWVTEIKPARNPKFHRYAFKMLHIMHDMIDTDYEFDPWRRNMTILAGYYKAHGTVNVHGIPMARVEADSLSFESMEQDDFEKFFTAFHRAFEMKYHKDLTYDQLCEWAEIG